jgi:hypothetical protein
MYSIQYTSREGKEVVYRKRGWTSLDFTLKKDF